MLDRKTTLAVALIASAGLLGSSVIVAEALADPTDPALDGAAAVSQPDRTAERRALAPLELTELAGALNETFVALADRVTPSVVRIEVRRSGGTSARVTPRFELPEPFRRFFEIPEGQPRIEPRPQVSGGTGFLISDDGYIVTNDHVVADSEEITVWLENRRSYPAELVGSDPTTDVAVIRIDGEDLPALSWGSSDDLRVGEWVVAVGNPGVGNTRPLDYTVTTGIVSAKDRPLQLLGRSLERDPAFGREMAGYAIENFIQTDAVINPGNSGGPLLNLRGEVVGINTAIASTSGYYQGYGFAVPANLASRVVADLVDDGRIERAWLGVVVSGVTPEDAELYGLPRVAGVLVQDVTADSPAEEAGLHPEDVIVSLDGEPVDRAGGLQQLVAERRPGQRVTVGAVRDGERVELEVELGEAPVRADAAAGPERRPRAAALERLGIGVQDMTEPLARRFGYEEPSGIVVTEVEPFGPAARRGVAPGLRVLEVNRTEVDSVRDLEEALDDVDEGDVVRLLLGTPEGRTRVANVRAR